MKTVESILELIGKTPLLRLKELEETEGGEIWAKLESLNPGFSVKDRIGLALIRRAETDGLFTLFLAGALMLWHIDIERLGSKSHHPSVGGGSGAELSCERRFSGASKRAVAGARRA